MEKNPSEQKPMKVFEPQTTEIQRSCSEQLIGLSRAGVRLLVGATTSTCSPPGCWGQQCSRCWASLEKAFAFLWLRHTLLITTWSGI